MASFPLFLILMLNNGNTLLKLGPSSPLYADDLHPKQKKLIPKRCRRVIPVGLPISKSEDQFYCKIGHKYSIECKENWL